MQFLNLRGHDDTAATAEYFDVLSAVLAKQVQHVFEVFDMATLVGGDCNSLDILLQRGVHDFADRTVVPKMDHLDAASLQDTSHDVDRRIVTVKQGSGGNKAHPMPGF